MLICHVINTLNRGGAETHLLDLIKEQSKNNYDLKIVVIGPDNKNIISIETEIKNLGIEIKRLNGPRMFNIFSYFCSRGQDGSLAPQQDRITCI